MPNVHPSLHRRDFLRVLAFTAAGAPLGRAAVGPRQTLYAVSNFHPACMGWLAPYYVERNYCLYSYLNHQDRVLKDPLYNFVFSEIPHLITMIEWEPERFEQLKGLVNQGRVQLVNAFVLEPTVNLSGGEALVMQGVEGLRWYEQVMGTSPRHCWMIDTTGWHEQMAQIVGGLELESFVYCRYNPTAKTSESGEEIWPGEAMHWIESPDGTRTLAVSPGHYAETFPELMRPRQPLPQEELRTVLRKTIEKQQQRFPPGAPLLGFAGQEDYSLGFNYENYPSEMIRVWEAGKPDTQVKMATLQEWFDAIKPAIDAGEYDLRTIKSGSRIYGWASFWVNAPVMKQWYRRSEHHLQSAEALTAITSLHGELPYPTQDFSNAWFLLALNMDRNLLWGAAIHAAFAHDKGWDARDRFETVEAIAAASTSRAMPALLGKGQDSLGLFNPSSWQRHDLFELTLPQKEVVADLPAQVLEDGKTTLVRAALPALGVKSLSLQKGQAPVSQEIDLPEEIETAFYTVRIDPASGALVSLRLKPSGREMLGGPANVVVAEVRLAQEYRYPGHDIPTRSGRWRVFSSSAYEPEMKVTKGPLATIIETTGPFHGGDLRRTVRFYNDSPRIDFWAETNDLPDGTIVSVEFPLAEKITEVRRGIPYGFSHGAWSQPNPRLHGVTSGIVPVIRWSHYTLAGGGGVALLDRGVPGRELFDRTALLLLHNTNNFYFFDNADWMSGKGRQRYPYALVAHESAWEQARIPQLAWDYNAPPLVVANVGQSEGRSFVETSDNVIVEALRRTGDEIELRLVESKGSGGAATVKVALPHSEAARTNLVGRQRSPLRAVSSTGANTEYRFEVRPQQIVTLRFKTRDSAPPVRALTSFDPIVPEAKRAYTASFKHPELKGHPPRRGVPDWEKAERRNAG